MNGETQLEQLLRRADCAVSGDWGEPIVRSPAKLLAARLRHQGFAPTQEFIVRFESWLRRRGVGFDPAAFNDEFYKARHFRQSPARHRPRIAIMHGLPILYQSGLGDDPRIVLLGILPDYASPSVEPVLPPPKKVRR
jgi:hypothetical protein